MCYFTYIFLVEINHFVQISIKSGRCRRTLPSWSQRSGQKEPIAARRKEFPVRTAFAAIVIRFICGVRMNVVIIIDTTLYNHVHCYTRVFSIASYHLIGFSTWPLCRTSPNLSWRKNWRLLVAVVYELLWRHLHCCCFPLDADGRHTTTTTGSDGTGRTLHALLYLLIELLRLVIRDTLKFKILRTVARAIRGRGGSDLVSGLFLFSCCGAKKVPANFGVTKHKTKITISSTE